MKALMAGFGGLIVVVTAALAVARPSASLPMSVHVAPGASLDQSDPPRASPCGFTGWAPDHASDWAAETFTAGLTGNLTDVVVTLRVVDPRVTVAITPVDTSGQPIVSRPLASSSLPGGTSSAYTDITVSFTPPVPVEAGNQYTIVLSASAGGTNNWTWKGDVGSSVTDVAGTRCADGAYRGGRVRVTDDPFGGDADFFFATYVVPIRQLTVATVGTGSGAVRDATHAIDCGATCSASFPQAASLTLMATPDPGSTFLLWTGGCAGGNPACSLTISGDVAVTAEFKQVAVSLRIKTIGRGTVSSGPAAVDCAGSCRQAVGAGALTLVAHSAPGWRFAAWRGCRSPGPVCRFTLLHAGTVTAVFRR